MSSIVVLCLCRIQTTSQDRKRCCIKPTHNKVVVNRCGKQLKWVWSRVVSSPEGASGKEAFVISRSLYFHLVHIYSSYVYVYTYLISEVMMLVVSLLRSWTDVLLGKATSRYREDRVEERCGKHASRPTKKKNGINLIIGPEATKQP